MKKVISVIMVITMLLLCIPVTVSAENLTDSTQISAGGKYYIYDADDLITLAELINQGQTCEGASFEMKNDIIVNYGIFTLDENGNPLYNERAVTENTILTVIDTSGVFKGTFDGKNYAISGLYSTSSGLFNEINGATVKNLCISNSLFDLRSSSAEGAGALCISATDSSVENIVFRGIIINDSANTGGIIGKASGTEILRCRNRGSVIGDDYCGGIVGKMSGANTLADSVNHGTVKSTGNYVGGITAKIKPEDDVKRCSNPGDVSSSGEYVGGIAGDISLDSTTMEQCYHTGTVSGNNYVGGIGGNFYSTGDNLSSLHQELADLLDTMEWYGEALRGDKIWIEVWPPAWADERYLEMIAKEEELQAEISEKSEPKNFLYSYSVGSVIANGEYAGQLFGGFSGCVWRFYTVYYAETNGLKSTGNDELVRTQSSIADERFVMDFSVSEENLKTSLYATGLSSHNGNFSLDENNENHGFVILDSHKSDANEPGCTNETLSVTKLTTGTTDSISFATDEMKIFEFSPEADGNYTVSISADKKAATEIKAYKNGELISEDYLLATNELSSAYDSYMKFVSEIRLQNLAVGDSVVLKITEITNYAIEIEPLFKGFEKLFKPTGITISVDETVQETPEDEPLFEFGVTAQHIQKPNDRVYYPVTFGFSMYDDADMSYSDICNSTADLAFGCDNKIIMKYIYDATTLDFIGVHDDSWGVNAEVLEHGSEEITGKEGQEYNYVIIQTEFLGLGYKNNSALYYLLFSVVEDNFINSDGMIRKVVDNAPYTENQLCEWDAWDNSGDSYDFSNEIRLKTTDCENGSYVYEDLLLEDDLIETNIEMPTVTFTPEHARIGDLAYYPSIYDCDVNYEEWVRSVTGFKESSTKIVINVNYDSDTLELVDALPSKELHDIGGTATIIDEGYLSAEDTVGGNWKYAVIQLNFDTLPFNNEYLFSMKFNVLQENFIDEYGRPIDLVFSDVEKWIITNDEGKSYDANYYVSNSYVTMAAVDSYEELVLADYEPFDPMLISDITEVTYNQSEDTHKTFKIKVEDRKSMIQFIEPDGGTRTYDRYHKNVKITSYNAEGKAVSPMSRELAYEVWEIYSNMSVGVQIDVRGKKDGVWDSGIFSFTVEEYSPVVSMELSASSGKKGPVPATVTADEKTEKVMFKMPDNTSVTVSAFTTDENSNRIFTGKAWMNESGLNEIRVYVRRNNVWKYVGSLEYTVE